MSGKGQGGGGQHKRPQNQVQSGRVAKPSAYREKQKHLSRKEKSQKFVSDGIISIFS